MRLSIVPLLVLVLALGGCAAHEPPRCTGALVPINVPADSPTVPDSHGQ
jgi:hypothetical protein